MQVYSRDFTIMQSFLNLLISLLNEQYKQVSSGAPVAECVCICVCVCVCVEGVYEARL